MDGTETGWGRPAEPAPRWRALLDRALLGARTGEQPQVGDGGDADPTTPAGALPPPPPPPPPPRPVNPLDRRPRNPLDQRNVDRRPGPPDPRPIPPDGLPTGLDGGRPAAFEGRPPTSDARSTAFDGRSIGLDGRPVNPLEQRPVNPLEQRPGIPMEQRQTNPLEQRPVQPLDRRPVNPLDRRAGRDARPSGPIEPRPVNPLERRAPRSPDAFLGRAEPSDPPPNNFFNPATRAVPPPIARVTKDLAYPSARAAASVSPASVAPAADPPARIEWRQARPDAETERAISVLRRQLGKPRVLAFANPKGGVHKTTATVLAAATVGSVRGRGVLAWDDNELRGTLGLRAGSARHARTIRHLVADLMPIENLHGDELTGRLDDYLRHASDGSYDVLAGEENPRFASRLDQHTVRRVMDLLRRTHEVICVDTGNNVESVNWRTVLGAADQLVITTVPREDAAFTADWMLDLLCDSGMAELAANAVTLLSCPTPSPPPLLGDLQKHFATRTRAVAVVPYDPALEVGSSIEYQLLQPQTRQAWLRAAAVMLEPFAQ